MDSVLIEALACFARVGVPAWERRRKQKILVDAELFLDLRKAGRSDRFQETVDYSAVAALIRETAEAKPFRLVEAIAQEAAEKILRRFKVKRVSVRIRKFSVPRTRSVGVSVTRSAGKRRSSSGFPRTGPR
ncbi:MAG: dihydroneopterin aldolase [Candidatus Omnitrophica bacterium]|nr:dihydroneopterin aldolase [Candidatus Omnitrophota bacterium]